jgi:hypothetical protein
MPPGLLLDRCLFFDFWPLYYGFPSVTAMPKPPSVPVMKL